MAEISSSARPKFPIEQMHAPRTNTTTSYSSSSNSSPLSAFSNKVVSSNPAPRTASSSGGNSGRGNIDILSAIPELAPIIQPEQEITTRPFRLKPSLGRTVDIKPEKGVDLARGIAFLGMKLKENDVRGDHIRQRFHERPGLRRKRLKSVRWRKRFMKGFKSMVGLVRHMRAQGW
ncbi:MAG: hypothetical protein M1823_000065 [Watsoniomyces obsoletus]|nr:MAG: hypothetical protein M1823_000065 [Watsoniomyces obsoletus]